MIFDDGIPASDVVILAPYLSDALRFAITVDSRRGISRGEHIAHHVRYDDDLRRKHLLTLAALAHPYWNVRPSKYDIGYALKLALDNGLSRAQLLAEIIYRIKDFTLSSFDSNQS